MGGGGGGICFCCSVRTSCGVDAVGRRAGAIQPSNRRSASPRSAARAACGGLRLIMRVWAELLGRVEQKQSARFMGRAPGSAVRGKSRQGGMGGGGKTRWWVAASLHRPVLATEKLFIMHADRVGAGARGARGLARRQEPRLRGAVRLADSAY